MVITPPHMQVSIGWLQSWDDHSFNMVRNYRQSLLNQVKRDMASQWEQIIAKYNDLCFWRKYPELICK